MIIMVYIYREIDVAASCTTQVIDSHHELLRRYNEGTLFSLLCDHVMCGYIQAVTIIITLLSYMPEGQNYLVKMDLDGSLFLHENSIFISVHVAVIPSPF